MPSILSFSVCILRATWKRKPTSLKQKQEKITKEHTFLIVLRGCSSFTFICDFAIAVL
ncbi:hypothetical protein OIU78_023323, partial [Salix suchowensis]